MSEYTTDIVTSSGSIRISVQYRVRPWGVDLDDVVIAGTDTRLPLTSREYYDLTREISRHLAQEGSHG